MLVRKPVRSSWSSSIQLNRRNNMKPKLIISCAGGCINSIRANFGPENVEVEIWDTDNIDHLLAKQKLDDPEDLDKHWDEVITKEYPVALY